ncbi:MAG TPA: SigE family RNA polymerase sigma factor [Acidimicrobiales bacterium]|jgi:RNA polymerase sigma-70 factor (ECF subfamily)|nr:SigE family RNA polymerase sigma factor [Acidimicrobiales bacterium]
MPASQSCPLGEYSAEVGPAAVDASFENFFAAEYRRVLGLIVVLCGDRGVAEELAQDAFINAYRAWSRIARYDDPAAWVRRVAANLATSKLRRRGREARALARFSIQRTRADVDTERSETDHFWAAVRALPRRQSQCVALHYLEDRPTAEIAAVLGIAEPTVRVHLHNARAALAARFHEEAP